MLEKITWKTFKPLSFPCMLCHEREAEYIRVESHFRLPVCKECGRRPWDEVMEELLKH